MGRMPRATYLWPGLPRLWERGQWSALAVAVGFAIWLNLALLSTLVWDELVSSSGCILIWSVTAVVWAGAALWARLRVHREQAARASEREGDGYCEAVEYYLKGNWFEAECVLTRLLRQNPRDLDARLLLATLFRHVGRHEEALRELARIERSEGCQKWELEVHRERQWLSADQAERSVPVERPGEGSDPAAEDEAA